MEDKNVKEQEEQKTEKAVADEPKAEKVNLDKSIDDLADSIFKDDKDIESIKDVKEDVDKDQATEVTGLEYKNLDYLDLKKEFKALEEKRQQYEKSYKREIAIARSCGMDAKTSERINHTQNSINECVKKQLALGNELADRELAVKNEIKTSLDNIRENVSQAFSNLKTNIVNKVVTELAAMKAINNKVKQANRDVMAKVSTAKDTYSTRLVEEVERANRKMLARNYALDQKSLKKLEKTLERLEKSYNRKANIKEAVKNLGRAFAGKEQVLPDKNNYTKGDSFIIDFIKEQINDLQKEMKTLEKQFEMSKAMSLQNLRSAQELRRDNKMKDSKELDRRLDEAKKDSIKLNNSIDKGAAEKTAEKTEKEPSDERVR